MFVDMDIEIKKGLVLKIVLQTKMDNRNELNWTRMFWPHYVSAEGPERKIQTIMVTSETKRKWLLWSRI